jgi:trigger factor
VTEPTETPAPTDSTVAVAEPPAEDTVKKTEGDEKPEPLEQEVLITDNGPCRKHIKVTIPAKQVEQRLKKKFDELGLKAELPGFRPGKAPRKVLEKKFFKDVSGQLKAELLMQSLEQLAEENKLNPISQPNLDPYKIEFPKDGPLLYEFDIEVAPEFDLPQYKGLQLKRPVREITQDDIAKTEKSILRRFGKLQPRTSGAEMDDLVLCDVVITKHGKQINKFENLNVRVDPQVAFKDGMIKDFGEKMKGVRTADVRTCDLELSQNIADPNLRGATVQAAFHVKQVQELKLPELTHEFLHNFDVHNVDQFHEKVKGLLQRQMEYEQRQAARQQVLQHFGGAANLELPRDLLVRQAQKTLKRHMLELQQNGFTEDQIRGRMNQLQQNALATTERSLKEHFVLQRVAEVEKLEVKQEDISFEIESIADQTGESPRRVRARMEKDDLMDSLVGQILEAKALNLVLDSAEYEEVKMAPEGPAVEAVEGQAVPGDQPELTPPPAEETEKQ